MAMLAIPGDLLVVSHRRCWPGPGGIGLSPSSAASRDTAVVVVVVLPLVEKGTAAAAAGVMVGEAVARRAKRKGADRRVEMFFILGPGVVGS